MRWWGWTGTGYKKGWFSGDVPGWHILCYNCGIWSNYIYIYVYPRGASPICAYPGYSNAAGKHAPTSISSPWMRPFHRIQMPRGLFCLIINLYRPITDQSTEGLQLSRPEEQPCCDLSGSSNDPFSSSGTSDLVDNPAIAESGFDELSESSLLIPVQQVSTGQASSSTRDLHHLHQLDGSCRRRFQQLSYERSCPTCTTSASLTAPYGYAAAELSGRLSQAVHLQLQ